MGGFNLAQYHATVDKVNEGLSKANSKVQEMPAIGDRAADHFFYPDWVKEKIHWCAKKIADVVGEIITKIQELMAGVLAPIEMFMAAWEWQSVRGEATGVQGN